MNSIFDILNLNCPDVAVQTLEGKDLGLLAKALSRGPSIYHIKYGLDSEERISQWLAGQLDQYKNKSSHPIIYYYGKRPAGFTSFHSINTSHRRMEVGRTWIAPEFRQTELNTKVKFLLLQHLIETLDYNRVEFCVDEANMESQMAMVRLGAHFEGVRKNYYQSLSGQASNSFVYVVTKPHWPEIKARLCQLIDRVPKELRGIPEKIVGRTIMLMRYQLKNAESLLELIDVNRSSLCHSFPKQSKLSSIDDCRRHIAQCWANDWSSKKNFYWGVFNQKDQTLIGQVGLKSVDWENRAADLGYYLGEAFRGQGRGKEMVGLVEGLANQLKLVRLTARVFVENSASRGLLESLGWENEGVMRKSFKDFAGETRDTVLYAKLV